MVVTVAKRSQSSDEKVQMSFRAPASLKVRVTEVADALGVGDESTLIRMLVTEFLPVYEARVRKNRERLFEGES